MLKDWRTSSYHNVIYYLLLINSVSILKFVSHLFVFDIEYWLEYVFYATSGNLFDIVTFYAQGCIHEYNITLARGMHTAGQIVEAS